MTDKQINAAIAEACGWKPDNRGFGWLSPHGYYAPNPDYCADLNAMHEAEKVLAPIDLGCMSYWLSIILPKNAELFHATARQRAEAFLRTLGKWEEVQG